MNDFFRRAGPEPYGRARPPSSFRDSLPERRDRVRDGLAEAASRAASGAVRRAAECLLGDGAAEGTGQGLPRRRGYDNEGWGHEYEDHPDDRWDGRRGGREGDESEGAAETPEGRPGSWRVVAASLCQAAASLVRTASRGGTL